MSLQARTQQRRDVKELLLGEMQCVGEGEGTDGQRECMSFIAAELERVEQARRKHAADRRLARGPGQWLPSDTTSLEPGAAVQLTGLSRADLNGVEGILGAFDPTKLRWAVQPDAGAKSLAVRPANLLRWRPDAATGVDASTTDPDPDPDVAAQGCPSTVTVADGTVAANQGGSADNEEEDDMYTDDVGRCFCAKHRKVKCSHCFYDFTIMNEMAEVNAGLRKAPTRMEELCTDKATIEHAMKFMANQGGGGVPAHDQENMEFHRAELARVDAEMAQLKAQGEDPGLGMAKAWEKIHSQDAERDAVMRAWSQDNPGQTHFELEAESTNDYWNKSEAPAASDKRDNGLTCAYCRKTGTIKLKRCARCDNAAYCGSVCQKAAWPGHKK